MSEDFFDDKIEDLIDKEEKEVIIISTENIELSDVQKQILLKLWRESPKDKPPKIKELVEILFPKQNLDGKSKQARVIKEFLAQYNAIPDTNVHKTVGPYVLTEAEKDFIRNHIGPLTPLEITRKLFSNDKLMPLSKEFRAIKKYIDDNNINQIANTVEGIEQTEDFDYETPKNYSECLKVVNKYNNNVLAIQDISEKQKRGVHMLRTFLNSHRFIAALNKFRSTEDKHLFLSEFVRATYDKPDLTVDEVNLYISLCASYPLELSALGEKEILNQKLEDEASNGRISTNTIEALTAKTEEYHEYQSKQQKLIKELNGSRATRINNQVAANQSVMVLVEYWMEEKKREKMLKHADTMRKALKETAQEILTMDSIKAEIYGGLDVLELD